MALNIINSIDLTVYADNPSPKIVSFLHIIHEAEDGEIVQYYIDDIGVPGDKNSYAIGVLNARERYYTYHDYPSLIWNDQKRRIATIKADRLGIKAFPGVGACAFYKLAYQALSKIVIPVNHRQKLYPYPTQKVTITGNNMHFVFTDPEKVTYQCYRVVLRCGEYAEEHITYEHELDCPLPQMNGDYSATVQGYISEGEEVSELSPEFLFTVNLPEQSDHPPTTTAGSDIFVSGLSFTQDNKLRATLTNGHNVDSINKVPTTERIACELLLSNWEEIEGHWEQTVIDSSIKDDDIFGEMYVEFTGSPQIDTLNNASLGCIAGAITSNGSITFYCYGNKPNASVTIYANRG